MILEKLVSIWMSLCDGALNQVWCLIFCGKIGTLVEFSFVIALSVVRMEVIFFVAAFIVWCFRFVTKTVLMITQKCFSYCWTVLAQNQGFHEPIGWGQKRDWEGEQLQLLIQTDLRDIPHYTKRCSAIKLRKVFQKPVALRLTGPCSADGSCAVIVFASLVGFFPFFFSS